MKVGIIGLGWVGKAMKDAFPDARGANSKCIPKDVYAWSAWAGTDLTKQVLEYNDKLINSNS